MSKDKLIHMYAVPAKCWMLYFLNQGVPINMDRRANFTRVLKSGLLMNKDCSRARARTRTRTHTHTTIPTQTHALAALLSPSSSQPPSFPSVWRRPTARPMARRMRSCAWHHLAPGALRATRAMPGRARPGAAPGPLYAGPGRRDGAAALRE